MSTTTSNRTVQPFLFFDGCCEQALEFYRTALGAEVTELMRFKDSPEPAQPGTCGAGSGDKVMYSSFRIGDATVMASDGQCGGRPEFQTKILGRIHALR